MDAEMAERFDRLDARLDRLDTCMDRLEAKVDRLVEAIEQLVGVVSRQSEQLADLRGDFKAVNARLDEQRATLNALIPTRLAAIPSSPAA